MFKKREHPFQFRLNTIHVILFLFLGLFFVKTAVAQTTPITFTGYTGAGFVPSPGAGQLDSDSWRIRGFSAGDGTFGGTHNTNDFARGTSNGGVTFGGAYAFNIDGLGNMIMGIQPSDADFTPGNVTLRVTNNTGNTISTLYVAYDIVVFNDQNRASTFNFSHSTDDTTYTPEPSLNFTTPQVADAMPIWMTTNQDIMISGLNLADGADFYLQWSSSDAGGSGSRDEFGLDNVEVRVNSPTAVSLTSFTFNQASNAIGIVLIISFMLIAGTFLLIKQRYSANRIS